MKCSEISGEFTDIFKDGSEEYIVATCVCRKDRSKVVLTFEKTRTAKQMLLQWIINRKCTIFVEVQETCVKLQLEP